MASCRYWYGSSNDPDNSYSIWLTKALISYESGVARKLDQIPSILQKKINQKKRLIGTDYQLVEALDEMKKDLMKEPHERHGYVPRDFREVWELSTDDEDHAVVEGNRAVWSSGEARKSEKARDAPAKHRLSFDTLKDHVLQTIEMWERNELRSTARIESDDIILNASDVIPDSKNKQHPYNRFLGVVATDMVSIYGEDRKTFFRQLYRYSKQWQALIARNREKQSVPKQLRNRRAQKMEGEDLTVKVKNKPTSLAMSQKPRQMKGLAMKMTNEYRSK